MTDKIWYIYTIEYYLIIERNYNYNVDEPWRHTKWKRSDTKVLILHDSFYNDKLTKIENKADIG